MKKSFFICLLALTVLSSCKDKSNNLPDGLYADIETNKGNVIVQLDFEKAPITVANFVTLVEGKNNFVAAQFKGKPFYDGLKFHRVIPEFMIQGGDPLGDGTGDAGYVFRDEITDMQFDKGGVLAMANSGPGTNSSQFFITHVATPWLEGKHTIFGHVIEKGMEIVNEIEPNDQIVKVTIIRNGIAAKRFDAIKVFANFFTLEAENLKKQAIIDAENKKIYDVNLKAYTSIAEYEAKKPNKKLKKKQKNIVQDLRDKEYKKILTSAQMKKLQEIKKKEKEEEKRMEAEADKLKSK